MFAQPVEPECDNDEGEDDEDDEDDGVGDESSLTMMNISLIQSIIYSSKYDDESAGDDCDNDDEDAQGAGDCTDRERQNIKKIPACL